MTKTKSTKRKWDDEGTSLVARAELEEEEYIPNPDEEEDDGGAGDEGGGDSGEGSEGNDEEADEQELSEFDHWVQAMLVRKFACEREFDLSGITAHPAIDVIVNARMSFFFTELKGFRQEVCRLFYMNMVIKDNSRIISEIGVRVRVTSKRIARYSEFTKPKSHELAGPKEGRVFGLVILALTDTPESYKNRRFLQVHSMWRYG